MAIIDAKKVAATYNMLKEKNIDSYDELLSRIDSLRSDYNSAHDSIKNIEERIASVNELIKYSERVSTHKNVYSQYLKSGKSPQFREQHHTEIALYESAQEMLKKKVPEGSVLKLAALKKEKLALEAEKDAKSEYLKDFREEQKKLQTLKKNVEIIMKEGSEKEQKEKTTQRKNQRE